MVKVTKAAKKPRAKASLSSSSSSSSSSSASASTSAYPAPSLSCSPAPPVVGAKPPSKQPLLNHEEQSIFKKHISEIKQLTALVILRIGLYISECPTITQKMQDDKFASKFQETYTALTTDAIVGARIALVDIKYLRVGTSTAVEIFNGERMRKRYSLMKSYINNTLTPLWKK